MLFCRPLSTSKLNRGVFLVSIRLAIFCCKKPALLRSPCSDKLSCFWSPITLTITLASRMSAVTLTPTTVTPCTRGSRISVTMAEATTSRIASAAFN